MASQTLALHIKVDSGDATSALQKVNQALRILGNYHGTMSVDMRKSAAATTQYANAANIAETATDKFNKTINKKNNYLDERIKIAKEKIKEYEKVKNGLTLDLLRFDKANAANTNNTKGEDSDTDVSKDKRLSGVERQIRLNKLLLERRNLEKVITDEKNFQVQREAAEYDLVSELQKLSKRVFPEHLSGRREGGGEVERNVGGSKEYCHPSHRRHYRQRACVYDVWKGDGGDGGEKGSGKEG